MKLIKGLFKSWSSWAVVLLAVAARSAVGQAPGAIMTVAGNIKATQVGDGGRAMDAMLYGASGLAVDGQGNLFISEARGFRIRKVTPDGVITTVAGTGKQGRPVDGIPAVQSPLDVPTCLELDAEGNLYIGTHGTGALPNVGPPQVLRMGPDGVLHAVAGARPGGSFGDGGPALQARLSGPCQAAPDSSGNLYIGDAGAGRVRKVSPDGAITTVAGGGTKSPANADGGPATKAQLQFDCSPIAIDAAGALYVAEIGTHRIRKVDLNGIITTLAGSGRSGFSGDGGQAVAAALSYPIGALVDSAGNLFFIDAGNNRIRKVSPDGIITTVAGNGKIGSPTDGTPATQAPLRGPFQLAIDRNGDLYFTDVSPMTAFDFYAKGSVRKVMGVGAPGLAARPALKITRSGKMVTLAWPTNAVGYSLEVSASLTPPISWAAVPTKPPVLNEQGQIEEAATIGHRFYRLKR